MNLLATFFLGVAAVMWACEVACYLWRGDFIYPLTPILATLIGVVLLVAA